MYRHGNGVTAVLDRYGAVSYYLKLPEMYILVCFSWQRCSWSYGKLPSSSGAGGAARSPNRFLQGLTAGLGGRPRDRVDGGSEGCVFLIRRFLPPR